MKQLKKVLGYLEVYETTTGITDLKNVDNKPCGEHILITPGQYIVYMWLQEVNIVRQNGSKYSIYLTAPVQIWSSIHGLVWVQVINNQNVSLHK